MGLNAEALPFPPLRTPGGNRTPNVRIKSPLLYLIELQVLVIGLNHANNFPILPYPKIVWLPLLAATSTKGNHPLIVFDARGLVSPLVMEPLGSGSGI